MRITAAKTGAGFSLVLGIAGLVQTHAFSNALLGFMAAGIIPGTDIKISADVMLVASALIMGAFLGLLLRSPILAFSQSGPRFIGVAVVVVSLMAKRARPLYKRSYMALKRSVINEVNTLNILNRRSTQRGLSFLKPWAEKALSYLTSR